MPILFAFAAAAFMSTVTMRMTDPVVGPLSADLGVDPAAIALFATAYALPYALFQLVFGTLGDRYGKVRVVRFAVVVLAATILATALAPDYGTMLGIRFVSGIFGGAIAPLGLAAIGDRFALPERQIMLSRFMLAMLTGQIAGSFLTGLLAEAVPWRAIYAGYAALALGVGLVLYRLPAAAPEAAEPITLVGALRRYARIVTGRRARLLLPWVFVEGALFFGYLTFAPPYLAVAHGFSPADIGLVIAAYGVGGILFTLVAPTALRILGTTGMIVTGGTLAAAGCFVFSMTLPLVAYGMLSALIGFAFTLIHNNLQTRATELDPAARGASVALFACCLFVGNGTGPVAMKALVDAAGYVDAFETLAAAMFVFGLAAATALRLGEARQ